jgi:SWI/SNF-related matrix-associated actin-dependent regulator 1 of chromatin subfamily A
MLLADEMGVGKTIQSLAVAYIYKHEWPLLIICPPTLKINWQN